jgi:hypothetical protein
MKTVPTILDTFSWSIGDFTSTFANIDSSFLTSLAVILLTLSLTFFVFFFATLTLY